MALVRQWIASPHFSAGRARNQIVCIHTSEGSTSQNGLAGFLANPSSRVSYQTCFDDAGDPNVIVECVRHNNSAWAAMNANSWGVHGCLCTPSGASAGWSRQVWLTKRTMLAKCAAWIAEECARYAIPVVKIDANEIRLGVRGVCGHGDVSAAGAGGSHFDPGGQFPWDHVIALAAGGAITPPPTEEVTGNMMIRDDQSGGYWIAFRDGAVHTARGAPFLGGCNNSKVNAGNWPCIGIATNGAGGYVLTLDFGPPPKNTGDRARLYDFARDGSGIVT